MVKVRFIKKQPPPVRIYILCHNEQRFKDATAVYAPYTWAFPIRMKYQDITFENAFWKQLSEIKADWLDYQMVGVLSSIAYKKLNIKEVDRVIHGRTWTRGYHNFIDSEQPLTNDHPHLLEIITDVCATVGITPPNSASCNYWMCTPALMVEFIEWFDKRLKPTVMAHPLVRTDARYIGKMTESDLTLLWGKPYYPHVPFVIERLNKAFFMGKVCPRIQTPLPPTPVPEPLVEDNVVFHKYYLGLAQKDIPIQYDIIQSILQADKQICHFHIYNIDLICDYSKYIHIIKQEYNIIITFNIGTITELDSSITYLKVLNKGFDIGPKICALHFLKTHTISYDFILFLHSKTNIQLRQQMFEPLVKNSARIKLLSRLMKIQPTLLGIFPDWCFGNFNQQGTCNGKYEYDAYYSNMKYFDGILTYLNIQNKDKEFAAGNMMILRRNVIDKIFANNLEILYNALNDMTSFDFNWFIHFKQLDKSMTMKDAYALYKEGSDPGNNMPIMSTDKTLPDAMIEHIFERIWLNVIKELNGSYLILDNANIIEKYKIKLNAIYFPQFHEIAENNEFWGDGFTEWTLLKPFKDNLTTHFGEVVVYKPHDDIGYYDLSVKDTLMKQIDIATNYGINGFIVYHYWFNKDNVLMTKPLEYFLDTTITFPFSISWANESWTRRWDGGNNEMLLEQTYNDHLEHIHYLIPFFKMPNYMRNSSGECIFYIYNISFIPNFDDMMNTWTTELNTHNLKIKIIGTNNSFLENNSTTKDRFIFEPMSSGNVIPHIVHNEILSYSYNSIIERYRGHIKGTNYHYGLPLFWNNAVRKPNYHVVRDFNMENLQEMLLILIAHIVLRNTDILDISVLPPYENFININAWNEWNEQAILEPNNITGYQTLETIRDIISEV